MNRNLMASILLATVAWASSAEEITKPPDVGEKDSALVLALRNLADTDPETRAVACQHFVEHPDDRAFEPLMRLIFPSGESEWKVRYHAVRAVGEIRRKEAYEHLLRVVKEDPKNEVKWVAVVAVGQTGDPRALDDLKRWLETPEPDYRSLAAFALGFTKDRRAIGLMTQALASPVKAVRRDAARALANFGDPEGCAIILGRIETEMSGEAMRAMLKALQQLKCTDAPPVFERMKKKLDTSQGEFLHMNTLMDDTTFHITGKRPE